MVTIGTDTLSQKFLADDHTASQSAIEQFSGSVEAIDPSSPNPAAGPGFWDKFTPTVAKVKAQFKNLMEAAEKATEHVVKLMWVFLLQTIVIPLLLLWGLYAVVRGTFELPRRRSSIKGWLLPDVGVRTKAAIVPGEKAPARDQSRIA